MFEKFKTSLPYAGTSGWSGSETSRNRAVNNDKSGKTSKLQMSVFELLDRRGRRGVTWKELGDLTASHHGSASGALSLLHKDGRISRLKETRNRCKVYVMNSHVDGRETEEHRGNKLRVCPNCSHEF